jgi:glycosyltransferase involved in cell wall biosynthesis
MTNKNTINNPLVSIIIPVYNTEKHLATCIDSVLSQSYTNLECILINDGSLDDSGKICDNYQLFDERIKVIHKENGGVSSARNKGLDIANGEWIVCVDSDDWIGKEYINEFVKASANADIVIQGYCRHFSPKKIKKHSPVAWQDSGEEAFEKLSDLYLNINPTILHGVLSKMFKKKILDDNHLRYKEFTQDGEDFLFSLSYLFYVNTISVISSAAYHYMTYHSCLTKTVFDIEKYTSWNLDIISAAVKISNKYKSSRTLVNVIISNRIKAVVSMCYLKSYVPKEKRLKTLSLMLPLLNVEILNNIRGKYAVLRLHNFFSIKALDSIMFFYIRIFGPPIRNIHYKLTGKKMELYRQ